MTAGASGTGTFGQILSSITGTLDIIMLSFLAAGVTGFLVLCLYTQKLFIGLVTYVMVFSVLVVLVFGTWIVNSTYYQAIIATQGQGCFPTWDLSNISVLTNNVTNVL